MHIAIYRQYLARLPRRSIGFWWRGQDFPPMHPASRFEPANSYEIRCLPIVLIIVLSFVLNQSITILSLTPLANQMVLARLGYHAMFERDQQGLDMHDLTYSTNVKYVWRNSYYPDIRPVVCQLTYSP